VQIIYGDGFYRVMPEAERFSLHAHAGYRRYYDWERLVRQVLVPPINRRTARYRRMTGRRYAHGLEGCEPLRNHFCRGCFFARPELRSYHDAIFLVKMGRNAREQRQRRRADAPDAWLNRWEAAEKHYLETSRLIPTPTLSERNKGAGIQQ
jgi:hypothetical protein